MHTDETLNNKFATSIKELKYSTLKKRIIEIDISFVIFNLLKYDFVVDINGSKYDLSFGLNKENGEIGNYQVCYPNSESLCSYEVIEKAFKEGKWFYVTGEDLTEEELERNIKEINKLKELEELKDRSFIVDRLMNVCIKKEAIEIYEKEKIKDKLMALSKEEFNDFFSKCLGGAKNEDLDC